VYFSEDEHEDEKLLPFPRLSPKTVEENVESNVSVSAWPQDGQSTCSFSLVRKHRYSKMSPQRLHLNSYIGTVIILFILMKKRYF